MADTQTDSFIKQREIVFSELPLDTSQAEAAKHLLSDVAGIQHIQASSRTCLNVHYDIRELTLNIIESALIDVGFHLDNNLLCKLKRALFAYTEETERINLGVHDKGNNVHQHIFINRYDHLQHGCRDDRPDCWRKYL